MKINIISYNILRDDLSNPDYMNQPKEYLDFKYRTKLLINKIEKIFIKKKNVIFCFQEVGSYQISELLLYFINKKYYGVYYGDIAIFYPLKKYFMIDLDLGPISNLGYLLPQTKKTKLKEMLESKRKYYMILSLKCKVTNKTFTISNTHLVAIVELEDLKFLQGYLIAKKLESYKNGIYIGDLNSVPSSNLIKLMKESSNKNNLGKFMISKKYKSVYNTELDLVTTQTSNSYTSFFSEMIDYIFIEQTIKVLKVMDIPNKSILKKDKFFPDKNEPSDHFMIGCELEIN